MNKRFLVAALAATFLSPAWAADSFVIKDIRVEGLQRTEPGTVFSYLPLKVGDTFTQQQAADAIKALFATGFFNDVRIETEGDVLILAVSERPVIAQLQINGSKEFSKDQLVKALKDNGLAESRIFDQGLLDQAVQELKRQYFSKGKYSVEIQPQLTRLERNRVAVTLDIVEGITAKIRDIRIVGAKAFEQDELLDEMALTPSGWLSWLSRSDQYSRQQLSADLEKLRAFYQNQGYAEFSIESTQVAISADKKDMFVTVNIREGEQFRIADVRLGGDLKLPEAELRKLLLVKQGDLFNREQVNETVTALSDRLGAEGYAFANVNVAPEVDAKTKQVTLTFFVDPGRLTSVRRVSIAGNTRTRDEVIRRELRQLESAQYNGDGVKRSKERLELLGYFESVNIETPPVVDTPDQVDMNVTVKERPTGSIQAGIGFAQGDGLQLSASVSQANVLGSGKSLSVSFANGKTSKNASISFTDPYYTVDGVSLGYDLYSRSYNPQKTDISQYSTKTTGFAARFGVPITEYDRISFSLGAEHTKITLYEDSPQRYQDFVAQYGSGNSTLLASAGWSRDTRDSALWPTRGASMSVYADAGLPGGDMQYYRLSHSQTWFWPLSKNYTLALGGEIGFANGYGRTSRLPFFQNYYIGGIGSVRGYDNGSLGPQDSSGDALGGTRKLSFSAELLFPFPGMKDNRSLRSSVFFDGGTLWDDKDKSVTASNGARYSTGLALSWLSPVGPMKFSYAFPIGSKETDKLRRFQFTLGQVF
ncbi:outer membrane protein assembly factor BamA [Vogesella fluminis]|uniref:Outer membrane protein assembly factor BamA n=1 Tax=Vogesella fluminis TaxID=1069161 RepID=A0ABQ3H8Z2_9NEIS|nr:outer membrane protein assembly factor BamA [Vogesella fluminis]GHD76685.1 outer membrane protein assembly factor BamA [Vogesella fluminis]